MSYDHFHGRTRVLATATHSRVKKINKLSLNPFEVRAVFCINLNLFDHSFDMALDPSD